MVGTVGTGMSAKIPTSTDVTVALGVLLAVSDPATKAKWLDKLKAELAKVDDLKLREAEVAKRGVELDGLAKDLDMRAANITKDEAFLKDRQDRARHILDREAALAEAEREFEEKNRSLSAREDALAEKLSTPLGEFA